MLVLTRKHQEKIRIGESITITVLRTKGKAVRLGIEAPADVPVIRGELVFEVSPGEPPGGTRGDRSPDDATSPTGVGRTGVRASRARPDWATDSHPDAPGRGEHASVSLRRVPRDRVAEAQPQSPRADHPLLAAGTRHTVLPDAGSTRCGEPVAGPRPLREMLDARTSVR